MLSELLTAEQQNAIIEQVTAEIAQGVRVRQAEMASGAYDLKGIINTGIRRIAHEKAWYEKHGGKTQANKIAKLTAKLMEQGYSQEQIAELLK